MEKKVFTVNGMACDHCKSKVERTLSCLLGVESAVVDLVNRSVEVSYDEELAKPEYMKKAIEEAGYTFEES